MGADEHHKKKESLGKEPRWERGKMVTTGENYVGTGENKDKGEKSEPKADYQEGKGGKGLGGEKCSGEKEYIREK